MKQFLLTVIAGAALGAAFAFLPMGGSGSPDSAIVSEKQKTRADLLKELDKLRIDGIRYISDGNNSQAVDVFVRLIDINPHDPFAYQRLAGLMVEVGQEDFERLLRSRTQGKPISLDIDRILGAVYFYAKKPNLADEHITRFLKERPNDLCATYYKGALARKMGDNRSAIELLTSVIEREKTYYYAYLELQQAYDEIGETDMANKMLGLALKNSPANKDGICCGVPDDKKSGEKGTKA